ncbi:DMT family transporter [Wenyingzhuangia marina]|uniref:Permease of the drug/metabolite transporter (DMT) superfamily n=1 Tax=Wenyingzhuangia marina TaxID=1195760 RepID=A0A1M5SLE7_9FLAO|nr:DMT family transporter [Wenyingzhuangia marina]GGF62722.1 membrane protein [Wenyingzhuangia marina]SHH39068.1 Permease of the drug/metabolite transporter (DMT) superfamily [Wenyingzhuangia marina]
MKNQLKNILELNLALLIIATAAPFGNYISLAPAITIWSRCLFAFIALFIFIKFKKISLHFNVAKEGGIFTLSAFLQAAHWITYFYALQLAGAGLGIISLFTYPIFTTLLEPLIRTTTFNPKHLFLGLIVLLGLYILTPEFSIENNTSLGIGFGVVSAIFYAIRNILMKSLVANHNATKLMFYQTGLIVVMLLPVFAFVDFNIQNYTSQLPHLLILGAFTTAVGHTYLVSNFKNFSATSASLLSCVQPLYGSLLAFIFLNEIPTISTVTGGIIIVSAVVLESFITSKD